MKTIKSHFIHIYYILSLCIVLPLSAQEVYKHIDANGKVHYSTKPPHTGAKPVDLPALTRVPDADNTKLLHTCDQHGGINCQAGADEDGSVICFNGFTDASARYNFSCSTALLRIVNLEQVKGSGTLKLVVRNARSVVADDPYAKIIMPNGKTLAMLAPEKIDAFGVGEFTFDDHNNDLAVLEVKKQNLQFGCRNCN